MKNRLLQMVLIFIFVTPFVSCDKDDDGSGNEENNNSEILGCTNADALNYDPEATDDDGSCIILGCTDESAINYNPEATDEDNSCEYSIASMLDGTWNITLLDYETEIDLSFLEDVIGFPLGNQEISGQAENAGTWYLNAEDYTYSSELDFETEPITIVAFEVPSIPFEYSNSGTWELTNNETDLMLTDDITGEQADYEIVSITENTAFMNGSVMVSQDVMGMDFTFELDVQMQLEKE